MFPPIFQTLRDAVSAVSAAFISVVHLPVADSVLSFREFDKIMKDILWEVDAAMDDLADRPYRDMKAANSLQSLRQEKFRLLRKADELQRQLRSWEERQPMILQFMRALEPIIRELRKARDILLEHGYDVSSIDATLQAINNKSTNRTTQNAAAAQSSLKRNPFISSILTGHTPVNIQAQTPFPRGASRDLMPPPRLPLQQRQDSNTARQNNPVLPNDIPVHPYDVPHHRGAISPSFVPSPQLHHPRPHAYWPRHDIGLLAPSPTSQPYLRTTPSPSQPIAVHRRFQRPDLEPTRASTYFPSEPGPSGHQRTYRSRLHRTETEAEPLPSVPNHLARQPLGPPQEPEDPILVWSREYMIKNPPVLRTDVEDGELDQPAPRTRLPPPVTPRPTAAGFRSPIHSSSSSVTSPFFGMDPITPVSYGPNNVSGRRVQR